MLPNAPSIRSRLAALAPESGLGWLSLSAGLLLAVQLARALWLLALHYGQVLPFPFPLDYGEGPLLDLTLRLASGENPYPADLSKPPFHIAVYPPFFSMLQLPFVWIFGPALWYGRLISVGGMLAAAVSCGLILRALTRDWRAAAVGAALLLASPYVVYWSPLARVDSLALGLSSAGLCLIVWGRGERRDRVLAALLFVAAAYTRQSAALAAPFAAFLWLLRGSGAGAALELAAWTAALGGAILLALNVATQGGFWLNVFSAHDVLFLWDTVRYFAREMLQWMPLLVVASFAYLLAGVRWRHRAWWVVAPYLGMGLLVALTIGKFGSNVNYLLEPVAGFSLVAGALIALTRHRPALASLLMFGLAAQVHLLVEASESDFATREMWKIERRDEVAKLADLIAASTTPVVADEFMALIPLAGRRLVFQPFAFSELARAGSWDEAPLLEALRRGELPLILLYQAPDWPTIQTRWSPAMIALIEEFYYVDAELAHTLVARHESPALPDR